MSCGVQVCAATKSLKGLIAEACLPTALTEGIWVLLCRSTWLITLLAFDVGSGAVQMAVGLSLREAGAWPWRGRGHGIRTTEASSFFGSVSLGLNGNGGQSQLSWLDSRSLETCGFGVAGHGEASRCPQGLPLSHTHISSASSVQF